MKFKILYFIGFIIFVFGQDPDPDDDCIYTGAIYEHKTVGNIVEQSAQQIIDANLVIYAKVVEKAVNEGANIIVFPEYGITGWYIDRAVMSNFLEVIPDVKKNKLNPCKEFTNQNSILYRLSCLAMKHKIYVAANMGEKLENYKRPENMPFLKHIPYPYLNICEYPDQSKFYKNQSESIKQYNTDVVFDKRGNLIAKYRKCHLCGEPNYDEPDECEIVTFDTDFAGKFGIFTCFDINWKTPAVDIVTQMGVRNILFPTSWPDLVPFLTANAVQLSYSIRMDVNLLAANTHSKPKRWGEKGSGIYSGQSGVLDYVYDYNETAQGYLLVVTIPCVPYEPTKMHDFYNKSSKSYSVPIFMDANLFGESSTQDLDYNRIENDFTNPQTDDHSKSSDLPTKFNNDEFFGPEIDKPFVGDDNDIYPTYRNFNIMWEKGNFAYTVIKPPSDPSEYNVLKTAQACHGNLCCKMDYKLGAPDNNESISDDTMMVLGAYNGQHVDFVNWYLQICFFNQCPTKDIKSCGTYGRTAHQYFTALNLTGNFTGSTNGTKDDGFDRNGGNNVEKQYRDSIDNNIDSNQIIQVVEKSATTYVFPFILSNNAELPCKCKWDFIHNTSIITHKGFREKVLTAALWGRTFALDNQSAYA